ncbi:hypothetical protein PRIPAC_72035, partial [Pristionchus pacificus]
QTAVSLFSPATSAPVAVPKTESDPEDVFSHQRCGSRPMPSLPRSLNEKTLSFPIGQPIAPVDAADQLASIAAELGRNMDSIQIKTSHPSSIPLPPSINALATPVAHKQPVKAVPQNPIPLPPSDSVQTLADTVNILHQQPLKASFYPSSILPLPVNVEAVPAKPKRHRSCNGVQFVKSCKMTKKTEELLDNRPKIPLKMIKAEPADADQQSCSSTIQNSSTLKKAKPRQSLPLVMPDLLPRGPKGVPVSIEDKKARRQNYYQRYYIRQKAARREKAAEKKAEKNRTLESISEKKNDDEVDLEFIKEVVESEKNRKDRDAVATPPMLFGLLNMKRETAIREEGVGEGAREEASQ